MGSSKLNDWLCGISDFGDASITRPETDVSGVSGASDGSSDLPVAGTIVEAVDPLRGAPADLAFVEWILAVAVFDFLNEAGFGFGDKGFSPPSMELVSLSKSNNCSALLSSRSSFTAAAASRRKGGNSRHWSPIGASREVTWSNFKLCFSPRSWCSPRSRTKHRSEIAGRR